VWLKKKNVLALIRDGNVAARLLKLAEECDPKRAVERLYDLKAKGEVSIEINQPSDRSKPIVLTVTYLPRSSSPHTREVFLVDQATKLVMAVKLYELKDGEYVYKGVQEYYDYNQPIEAKMFTLDEVPADALQLDQVTQEIGLVQGQLSDKEIAVKVVQRFFEALIAKDYAEAGRIYQGISAEKMEEFYGKGVRFVRIVSIGEPTPESKYDGKLRVPCTVEFEKDGQISQWPIYKKGLLVGPVNNQPGQWAIFGGI
ncbi:MAG TPA: hypothetical protein HPP87_13840, partial [Planctomycetes bacterium]|nr:hypothetical protein [Planctomycetota bacterium]